MSLLRAIGNFILIMVLYKSLILSYVFPSGDGFHTIQYNTIILLVFFQVEFPQLIYINVTSLIAKNSFTIITIQFPKLLKITQ